MDKLPAAQAVEQLLHEYGNLVFHTIYGLTGDWEESQDLTQDTFSAALRSIDAVRAKGEPFHAKAWLLQIALNTVRMQRRRRSIFRFIPFSRVRDTERSLQGGGQDESAADLSELAAPVQPPGYGAVASVNPDAFVAEQDAVQRAMAQLSENLRVCLLLSVVGQFTSGEIAEMLHLEEAAVRQRLARARKQFAQYYLQESGEEVFDNAHPAGTTGGETRVAQAKQQTRREKRPTPNHPGERVESRHADMTQPAPSRRNHAERFYRDPAVTPLW